MTKVPRIDVSGTIDPDLRAVFTTPRFDHAAEVWCGVCRQRLADLIRTRRGRLVLVIYGMDPHVPQYLRIKQSAAKGPLADWARQSTAALAGVAGNGWQNKGVGTPTWLDDDADVQLHCQRCGAGRLLDGRDVGRLRRGSARSATRQIHAPRFPSV